MFKLINKIIIVFIIIFFWFSQNVFWACDYIEWDSIKSSLDNCLEWASLVSNTGSGDPELKIKTWLKDKINDWTINVATFLSIFAVWAIVFWAFQLVISWWNDEKITKWKDIVKWSMAWFLLVVSASAIVKLIVEIMYSLG